MTARQKEIRERIIASAIRRAAIVELSETQEGVSRLLRWVRTARRARTIQRLERTMIRLEGEQP